jgi:hypothetical protein
VRREIERAACVVRPSGVTVAPLSHASRGPHPGDAKRFGLPQLARLRDAARDVAWLVDRSYPRESAVRFVGDHYQLAARQRLALFRGVVSGDEQRRRATHEERVEEVRERTLLIDGLNLVIGLEVALAGGPLLACADGAIRDLAGLHGSYRPIRQTEEAIERIGGALTALHIAGARIYLDAPVPCSGKLRALFLEHASRCDCPVRVDLVRNPDACLAGERHVVSADAAVIDGSASWFNLGAVLVRAIEGAWVIAL